MFVEKLPAEVVSGQIHEGLIGRKVRLVRRFGREDTYIE